MHSVIRQIEKDMRRHKVTVTLPGKKTSAKLYLIMVTGKASKFKDFMLTYGKRATDTHQKLAKKIFGEGETDNTYGVLVDPDLRLVFAFNRDFADYDRKKQKLVYKDIDDLLIERVKVKPEDLIKPKDLMPRLPRRKQPPSFPGHHCRSTALIKYSLTEKKQGRGKRK